MSVSACSRMAVSCASVRDTPSRAWVSASDSSATGLVPLVHAAAAVVNACCTSSRPIAMTRLLPGRKRIWMTATGLP